ncbi:hypothetical protein F5984_16765 [Rudanella paleaurantiibacter]|uniref:G8 domain-containing protein n=1 Tax=Rudanella paleaurantiibacter TaxID=2614655 RepID=A0A7J5TXB0_9BACT|nr:hypothetical protein [Rudanella paleaurantiibacter]KAB7729282.1 hypothetical protein F5984_16765 [Rudanella paleaurantiibacter]
MKHLLHVSSLPHSSSCQSRRPAQLRLWLTLLLLVGSLSASLAQTVNWTGATSSNWNIASNWNPATVPTATNDVVISSTATTQPTLSTTAVAKSVEVRSGASLSISSAGSLTVNGNKVVLSGPTTAFYNGGTVVNEGSLVLGSTGAVGLHGLWNVSSFSNVAGGSIRIDRSTITGLNNQGNFVNSASITIGASATVGTYGLTNNNGSFSNVTGGSIQIDRSSLYSLLNTGLNGSNASFINSASITIGASATVGETALYNEVAFTNTATGSISLDQGSIYCFRNNSGSFINSGSLAIGTLTSGGIIGLWNRVLFTNTVGARIFIDRATGTGLFNDPGSSISFVNAATITIGTGVTGTAINNQATFNNQGCPALIQSLGNGVITNSASFSNTGTIIENASGNSNISFNGGLVQNLNGGSFTVASGPAPVTGAGLYWRGCTSTNWNTAANWYPATVPTPTDNVIILLGAANMPTLSTTAVANSVEVQSGASLSIGGGGSLTINGNKTVSGNTTGFYNGGTVVNAGALILGNSGSVGQRGLWNVSSFSNMTGGNITIDRASNRALLNDLNGSFVNSASITIGASNTVTASVGLENSSSFTNQTGGSITIDRATFAGLNNLSGSSFINSGILNIGATANVGLVGLGNSALFRNASGGSITISRASGAVLNNQTGGIFVNLASLTIGAGGSPSTIGLRSTIKGVRHFCRA